MTTTPELQEGTRTTKRGPKVAIVGSGVIGLHCALEVIRAGGTPSIYEAGREIGYPFDWERPRLDEVDSEYPINALRIKALGGTTLHWGGTVPRLEIDEYESWVSGESYESAERYLGVFTHPMSWFEEKYFIPALDSLEWGFRFWRNTTNPAQCKAYATCSPHCPTAARYSPVRTINDLKPYGVSIATNIQVRHLDGLRKENDLVIVAAGTVESTRLALQHGIESQLGFAHGVVLTSATAQVRTGGFRIGFPTVKAARPKWDIFVDPTAGMPAPEWIARGYHPKGFGYEFVLASHTAWGEPSIKVSLSDRRDDRNVAIPKVELGNQDFAIGANCAREHELLIEELNAKEESRRHFGISWDHLSGTLRDSWDQGDLLFLGNAALPTIGKANPTLTSLAFAIQELRKRL